MSVGCTRSCWVVDKRAHPSLADRFASLRADTAVSPQGGWLLEPLHALILAALTRVFGRLEQLLRLWQAGTLPAPHLVRHCPTRPGKS